VPVPTFSRRAKIVATLGPASEGEPVLRRLLRSGVDVVRLNLSHGSHEEHRRRLRLVRRIAAAERRHVPVVLDLMGPRYRLGEIAGGPRRLRRGETVRLGAPRATTELPIDDLELLGHLEPGERVLIDNGLVELEIERRAGSVVVARVLHGGPVSTRKGINLPDTDLPFAISRKDRADIAFAVAEGADFLAASYVARGREIEALRAVARGAGCDLPIIAKIERARALDWIDEIVEAADAVMVARGDLGVEVALDRVPVLQKRIVAAGRRRGKPVIVATQMLESMTEQPRPTRAEASDVANAVFDGADALMLSGETAAGRYPVEAVRTMDRIIRSAEEHRWSSEGREGLARRLQAGLGSASERRGEAEIRPLSPGGTETVNPQRDVHFELPDIVCGAAVEAATRLGGAPIVAFSQGGFTARMIARYRPTAPVYVFTNDRSVARRVQLVWGVRPVFAGAAMRRLEQVVRYVDQRLLEASLVRAGDPIVILMGDPISERPLTNLMRVHRVRAG
jgi:pyruvate kinase